MSIVKDKEGNEALVDKKGNLVNKDDDFKYKTNFIGMKKKDKEGKHIIVDKNGIVKNGFVFFSHKYMNYHLKGFNKH